MDLNKYYVGKRVRLKADASYGQRIASYLTEEQASEGPQGIVVGELTESDGLFLEVDLENVPGVCRFPEDSCVLLDSGLLR
jgi:hypothetical protein